MAGREQAGGDQGDADAFAAEAVAERPEVRVEQRLAAGQHHPPHAQPPERIDMAGEHLYSRRGDVPTLLFEPVERS